MKQNIKTVKTHLGISVIQCKDSDNFFLLGGKDVVSTGNQILMFWATYYHHLERTNVLPKILPGPLTLKMKTLCCFQTSGPDHPLT